MDESTPIPHTWREFAWLALVAIIANRANWLTSLFTRKQTKASAEKTEEEARELELANDLRSGDALVKLTVRMVKATERAERVQLERDHWRRKAEAMEAERDLLSEEIDRHISVKKRLAE